MLEKRAAGEREPERPGYGQTAAGADRAARDGALVHPAY
jgi:hypothetical protein